MEITPEIVKIAEAVQYSANHHQAQRQWYAEINEKNKTFYTGNSSYPFDRIDDQKYNFGRACAHSVMFYNHGQHLICWIGKERGGVIDHFLELVPDMWEKVTDETILIRNYHMADGNRLGRLVVGIRGPKEHGIDKGFKYMLSKDIPAIIALHLAYIINIENDMVKYVDSHQMFSYTTANVELAKLIKWVLSGKDFWNHTTARPAPKDGHQPHNSKWAMGAFDGQFSGFSEVRGLPGVAKKAGFTTVHGYCAATLMTRIHEIITTETLRVNLRKAMKQ